jgi:hypothetical protein
LKQSSTKLRECKKNLLRSATRQIRFEVLPNIPLQMNTWHTLNISVHGTNLHAGFDGKHLLDYTLAEAVSGRIGVWSKTHTGRPDAFRTPDRTADSLTTI